MAGIGQTQGAIRVDNLHLRQPVGELRRMLQAQQSAGVKGIVERGALVVEHNIVSPRNADQKGQPGRAEQRQQGIHIVLIRFGIMSPTESGSFACAYALLVGTVFYHELTWESLLQTLRDSVKDITVITIILAFSGVFGYGIVFDNITVTIANALLGITSNSAILLLLVVVFLLICGMFMETTVIALILTPILLPVMRSIGVNEVVFGMIMMTTVTFGVMTPPVGTALYAVSDIMECPIEETFKKGWPFYLAIVCVILFMIFFPQAVLFLPNLVYGA